MTDINDNVFYFFNGSKFLFLSEIFSNGSKVYIGSVIDRDIGVNIVKFLVVIISGN